MEGSRDTARGGSCLVGHSIQTNPKRSHRGSLPWHCRSVPCGTYPPSQLHHGLPLGCVSSAYTLDKMSLYRPAMIPSCTLCPSLLVLSTLLAPKMSRPSPGTPNVPSHHLQDSRSRPRQPLLCCCPFEGPHSIPVSEIQLTKWVFSFGRSPSFQLLI